MNPNDVIVPSIIVEGTNEELNNRAANIRQQIRDLDPFLVALAEAFQSDQSEGNLAAFLALDAKRMEMDNVLAQQLAIIRNRNIT